MFDNGFGDRTSRITEYHLDESAKTATLVWSYPSTESSDFGGSARRLANGNTLIAWTVDGTLREVTQPGAVVYEMSTPGWFIYRALPLESFP